MTPAQGLRRFGPIALIAALLIVVVASGALNHLSLSELKVHRASLSAQVNAHPLASLAIYLGLYVLVIAACVPGPGFMNTAGGFLFGTLVAGFAAEAACIIGGVIVFLACRTAFGDFIARRAGPLVRKAEAALSGDPFSWVLTLRLIPVAPFFVVNIAAGMARVPLSAFVAGTAIGSAPSSFIFAGLGAGLGELFDRDAHLGPELFETPQIMLPLAGLAVLSIAPILWRRFSKRTRPSAEV